MSSSSLNLARKWRSKTFDEIVGQELAVKMLKNSLYLNHYFPVYLFAGQKGCGKTSTARIFAMAINCEMLGCFQQNPRQNAIPCLNCSSCVAMQQGRHPDFIEIDAASNTGVDNVRTIIDAAALLPLMGKKRIYLIDEAHMLSKAAFNAFLKLLEEPPVSALFMLATTDSNKIIDTVRSRCFQLSFKPVALESLLEHLRRICHSEVIPFEESGLVRIIHETGGCVRDALNLLEQVRFSHPCVDENAVREVLGYLDDVHLIRLYALIIEHRVDQLVHYVHELNVEQFSAEYIWKRFVALLRAVMWVKVGLEPLSFTMYREELQQLAQAQSWATLSAMSSLVFEQEISFSKTAAPHIFLETMFIRLASRDVGQPIHVNSAPQVKNRVIEPRQIQDKLLHKTDPANNTQQPSGASRPSMVSANQESGMNGPIPVSGEKELNTLIAQGNAGWWQQFLSDIEQLNDPLVSSVFRQGSCVATPESTVVIVEFPEKLVLFKDHLEQTASTWLPFLRKYVSAQATLEPRFVGATLVEPTADSVPSVQVQEGKKKVVTEQQSTKYKSSLDISDTQKWAKTHLLLRYFPGIVREIHEG